MIECWQRIEASPHASDGTEQWSCLRAIRPDALSEEGVMCLSFHGAKPGLAASEKWTGVLGCNTATGVWSSDFLKAQCYGSELLLTAVDASCLTKSGL